jgi:hypothetical protein
MKRQIAASPLPATALQRLELALLQRGSQPLVAAVVSAGGGWDQAGAVLALFALANLGVAWAIGRYERGVDAR